MSGVRLDAADNQNARIFVGNVAPNTDEDLLTEHFKKHGPIKGVVVLKGFGFVQVRITSSARCVEDAHRGGGEGTPFLLKTNIVEKKCKNTKPNGSPYEFVSNLNNTLTRI